LPASSARTARSPASLPTSSSVRTRSSAAKDRPAPRSSCGRWRPRSKTTWTS
jgi:hypothetical protein